MNHEESKRIHDISWNYSKTIFYEVASKIANEKDCHFIWVEILNNLFINFLNQYTEKNQYEFFCEMLCKEFKRQIDMLKEMKK